ncbi:MAG TPA: 30S ribosomal protein S2 [Solirubrobacteraceae bacterium]|nr:30S ribosomal protein S2 [Solirubrobacteraceae bacterium]
MADVSIAELLEAGVHFGHQTRRWNPKMRRFIYGERGGIYIIDLLKTSALLAQAQEFASTLAHRGGTVLFVGTKKQARDTIRDVAEAAGMPYVNHRWLGGLLTNFETISQRIRRLHDLERFEAEGQLELLPTRERMSAQADLAKLRANLGGVKNMQRVPDAMFVIDLKTEVIAVKEAQRLRIPIMGLVDTNCDPDGIDFVIPGNDDAIRSCALITQAIGQVVADGHSVFRAEEERARQEAEEKARIEAEARAKREAEEQAKREAEEQVKKDAEDKAAAERAAAAAATQQTSPESTPVPAAPADPATLEPRSETVTPISAGADARQPANPQSAPAETIAESAEGDGQFAESAPAETQPAETPAAADAQTAEEPAAEAAQKAEEPPAEAAAEESAPAAETAEAAGPELTEAPEPPDANGSPPAAGGETAEQTTETGAK